ncbi:MAG: hypothetical protein ACT4O9_07445 [Blastocatellia bacterium]
MNKLRIKKLGILSVAKIYAVMSFVISLLIAIPYGLVIIIISLTGAAGANREMALLAGGGGIIAGIAVMIILPIMYAIIGFIAGVIGALVYNIFAGIVGGIEIEVENVI